MKIFASLITMTLIYLTAFSQTLLVSDHFVDRSKFHDNSLLLLWGGNATPVTGFSISPKVDNNSLSYDAISLTPAAQSNSGYTSASSLKTATCIDYPLPVVIDRNSETIRIEFDAIWDATNASGENGRLVITLMGDYPPSGAAFDDINNTALSDPFGKPLYNVRIRNNPSAGNGPLMLYGAGTTSTPEWEVYTPGPWWLPGFSVQSGGGSPGSGPDYPGSGTKKVATSIVSITQWKHYTWLIKPERMELYYRNSNQTAASDVLVFFMQIPKNTSDPYVISEINAAHGTAISSPPPNYNWFQYANAVRFYWRGVNNTYLANVSISRSSLSLPLSQLQEFSAQVKDHIVSLKGIFSEVYADNHVSIEHSTDGRNFLPIGDIDHRSLQSHFFVYEDHSPSPGSNFYRVKLTDKDGALAYSKVVSAYLSETKKTSGVRYVGYGSLVTLFNETTIPTKIDFLTSEGKRIHSELLPGAMTKSITLKGHGIYFYYITQRDKKTGQGKLIIQP